MTQALLLLTMALQLLVAASQPNVPEPLKESAISVANTAIEVANKVLHEPEISISEPKVEPIKSEATSTPVLPVIQPVTQKEIRFTQQGLIDTCTVGINGRTCWFEVLYIENGKITDTEVSVSSDDGYFAFSEFGDQKGKNGNPASGYTNPNTHQAKFYYYPRFSANPVITASSSGVSVEINILGQIDKCSGMVASDYTKCNQ